MCISSSKPLGLQDSWGQAWSPFDSSALCHHRLRHQTKLVARSCISGSFAAWYHCEACPWYSTERPGTSTKRTCPYLNLSYSTCSQLRWWICSNYAVSYLRPILISIYLTWNTKCPQNPKVRMVLGCGYSRGTTDLPMPIPSPTSRTSRTDRSSGLREKNAALDSPRQRGYPWICSL